MQTSPLYPLAVWLEVQPEASSEPERVHSDVKNKLTDKRQLEDIAVNTIVRIERKLKVCFVPLSNASACVATYIVYLCVYCVCLHL